MDLVQTKSYFHLSYFIWDTQKHFCISAGKKETDVKLTIGKGRMDRYKIEGQIICFRECGSRNDSF